MVAIVRKGVRAFHAPILSSRIVQEHKITIVWRVARAHLFHVRRKRRDRTERRMLVRKSSQLLVSFLAKIG